MTKQDIKRWWAWAITAALLAGTTLMVWLSPVEMTVSAKDDFTMTCASPANYGGTVDFWPYLNEVQAWVQDGRDTGPDAYLDATIGAIEQCNVARDHRNSSLLLLAIASATVIIVTRPRGGGRSAQAEGGRGDIGQISGEATPQTPAADSLTREE